MILNKTITKENDPYKRKIDLDKWLDKKLEENKEILDSLSKM